MEFHKLEQRDMSIREYELRFIRLMRFAAWEMGEHKLIKKFLGGLKVEIRTICQRRDYTNLVELVEKATLTEMDIAENAKESIEDPREAGRTPEPAKQGPYSHTWMLDRNEHPHCKRCNKCHPGICLAASQKCFGCGQPGQKKRECPQLVNTCFRCGRVGHKSLECKVRMRAPHQGNQNHGALPPPPERQATGLRAYVAKVNDGANSG